MTGSKSDRPSLDAILLEMDFFKRYSLSRDELQELINRAGILIDKYTSQANALISPFQKNDYKYVLSAIKAQYDNDRKWHEERFSSVKKPTLRDPDKP